MMELACAGYRARAKANVSESDGTLIISIAPFLSGGSKLTTAFAKEFAKPYLHVDLALDWRVALKKWLEINPIEVLNVAGLRAIIEPDVVTFTREVLDAFYPVLVSGKSMQVVRACRIILTNLFKKHSNWMKNDIIGFKFVTHAPYSPAFDTWFNSKSLPKRL